MRTPSRFLFSAPQARLNATGWLVIAVLCAGLLYGFYRMVAAFIIDGDPLIFFISALVAWLMIASIRGNRQWCAHFRTLARQRRDHSICDFARSFDAREVDTWVIRAAWNVLSESINRDGPEGFTVPIFADDRLADEFMLEDDEDLLDTLEEMAHRAGRSTELLGTEGFSGPVITVRDAVLLLNALPMTEARKQRRWIAV